MGNSKYIRGLMILTLLFIYIASCKKSNPATPGASLPAITGISPLNGFPGSVVVITGTGFNAILANDTIKFNGIIGIINSVSATQIIVNVPSGATSGGITLSSKGMNLSYPTAFTVNSFTTTTLPTANLSTFTGAAIANIAIDAVGNIYGNTNRDTVYKITPSGVKSMFAIVGASSTILGGTAIDATGNIYIVGTNDFKIYKITPAGVVSIFAGSGVSGFAEGQGAAAQFAAPVGIAIDASGNLYVTDVYRVRKVTPAGMVSTFAGGAAPGNSDGQGQAATFGVLGKLTNVAIDAAGNIFLSEGYTSVSANSYPNVSASTYYIRKITPGGAVTTVVTPIQGSMRIYPEGISLFTSLLAVDAAGDFFVPGAFTEIYSNAGGAHFFAPIVMVNKAGYSSYFFGLENKAAFTSGNYTGITFDAMGNMYVSAAIVNNPNAYFPFGSPFPPGQSAGNTTAGSMIIKFTFK